MMNLCEICGKEFIPYQNHKLQPTCGSIQCKYEYRKKYDTSIQKRVRIKNRYDGNRNKAWERDDYTCQLCGSKESLVAHHIDGSGTTSTPNHSLDNLVTLCNQCHTSLHAGGRVRIVRLSTCEHCGKTFRLAWGIHEARFCSRECLYEFRRNEHTSDKMVTCINCGEKFSVELYDQKRGRGKFCTKKCQGEYMSKQVETTCLICGEKFFAPAYKIAEGKGKYCGKLCQYKGMALKFKVRT